MKDITTKEEKSVLCRNLCALDTRQQQLEIAVDALALASENLEDESMDFIRDPLGAADAKTFAARLPLLKAAVSVALWTLQDVSTGMRNDVDAVFSSIRSDDAE